MKRFTSTEFWLLVTLALAIGCVLLAGCSLFAWPGMQSGASAQSEVTQNETTAEPDSASLEAVRLVPPDRGSGDASARPPEPAIIEFLRDGLRIQVPVLPGTRVEAARAGAETGKRTSVVSEARGSNEVTGVTDATLPAPTVRLPSGQTAGGGPISFLAEKVKTSSLWILHAGGLLIIAAGLAVAILLKMPGKGLLISLGGGAATMVPTLMEWYPWVVLVLPVLGIGAVAWLLWGLRKGQRRDAAFGAVARGIQVADEDGKVRDAIGNLAGVEGSAPRRLVKAEVTKVRKAEGLA